MGNSWNMTPKGRRSKTQGRRVRREEYLVGRACVECGHTEELTVTWITTPGPFPTSCIWGYGPQKRQTMLAQCQVVCFGCLTKRRGKKQQIDHGGGVRGINGCDCDPCKAKRKAYLHERYMIRKKTRPKEKK